MTPRIRGRSTQSFAQNIFLTFRTILIQKNCSNQREKKNCAKICAIQKKKLPDRK